jgi:hypothetical protein
MKICGSDDESFLYEAKNDRESCHSLVTDYKWHCQWTGFVKCVYWSLTVKW